METHEVTEPVDYRAYHQARSRVLGLLSMWLADERDKLTANGEQPNERWKALADVTAEMDRLENQEVGV